MRSYKKIFNDKIRTYICRIVKCMFYIKLSYFHIFIYNAFKLLLWNLIIYDETVYSWKTAKFDHTLVTWFKVVFEFFECIIVMELHYICIWSHKNHSNRIEYLTNFSLYVFPDQKSFQSLFCITNSFIVQIFSSSLYFSDCNFTCNIIFPCYTYVTTTVWKDENESGLLLHALLLSCRSYFIYRQNV